MELQLPLTSVVFMVLRTGSGGVYRVHTFPALGVDALGVDAVDPYIPFLISSSFRHEISVLASVSVLCLRFARA